MDIFNNREIAIGIWFVILILWGLSNPPIKKSMLQVVSAFFNIKIQIPLSLMTIYIGFLVYGLHELGLWTMTQLKNTIMWSGSVAAMSLFRMNDIVNDHSYFRTAIKDSFKIIVVIEFVIAFYTFPFWVEFILMSLLAFLGAVLALSETDKKYVQVERFLTGLFEWFGLALISYAIFKIVSEFETIAQFQTLTDFSLPLILSILFLPFIFFMSIYVNYENAFVKLQILVNDSSLRFYAKRSAIFAFHFRTELLKRWARNLNLSNRESRQDIRDTIREVKASWNREKNPEVVPFKLGWSPYSAREFLIKEGLITSDYHRTVGGSDDWCASSDYFRVGDGLTFNCVTYHIEGNESVTKILKLVMEIYNPEVLNAASDKFCEFSGKLFEKALKEEMPEEIKRNLLNEIEMITNQKGKRVIISKELWPSHRNNGYSVNFIIENFEPEREV